MSEHNSTEVVEDEVAAELQNIFAFVGRLWRIASEDSAKVFPEYTGPEECEPAGAFESECAIREPLGIAHNRDMPACAREIKRQHFGLCLRDNENGTACCRELLAGSVHLAEVGIAGDSGEMP